MPVMENLKHTPGPWKSVIGIGKKLGVRDSGGFICFLTTPNHYTGQDERYFQEMSEWQANAALIAAAPDLLAALKEIGLGNGTYSRDPLQHASNTIEAMKEIARAAIAKAETV